MKQIGEYEYREKDLIGIGSYARVYKGRGKSGEEVAIKEIEKRKISKNVQLEVEIMKRIKHDHIIELLDVHDTADSKYLVLEYCPLGDFATYLSAHSPLPEDVSLQFLHQLISSLYYLSTFSIIHRDLKPSNILLTQKCQKGSSDESAEKLEDESTQKFGDIILKICDFGFARFVEPTSIVDTMCGSPLYMAPEVLNMSSYDNRADVWSLGCIFYQMLYGRTPYNATNVIELLHMLQSRDWTFPSDGPFVSSYSKNILQRMLQKNPNDRANIVDLYNTTMSESESESESESVTVSESVNSRSRLRSKSHMNSNTRRNIFKDNKDISFHNFIILQQKNNDEKQIDETVVDDKNVMSIKLKIILDEIEDMLKRIYSLSNLAYNLKRLQNLKASLMLFMKSVNLLEKLCYRIEILINNSGEEGYGMEMCKSPRLYNIVDSLMNSSVEYIGMIARIFEKVDTEKVDRYGAEKIIYENALKFVSEAAVQERLPQLKTSQRENVETLYVESKNLFNILILDSKFADKTFLSNIVDNINSRLQKIKG